MSMSNYNRENPFMYLYEKKQMCLEQESTKAVREMIIMCIYASIAIIGRIICNVMYQQAHCAELCIITGLALFGIMETVRAVSTVNKNSQELNHIIFSDK